MISLAPHDLLQCSSAKPFLLDYSTCYSSINNIFFLFIYQLEANYFTILQWFLTYIDMNQPWIYMCSPSRSPLPPSSPPDPSGSSQCTRPEHLSHASNLAWRSVSPQIIYMFRCCSLKTSHPRLLPQSPKFYSVHLCLFFQKDKDQYTILTRMYGIQKDGNDNPICKTDTSFYPKILNQRQ